MAVRTSYFAGKRDYDEARQPKGWRTSVSFETTVSGASQPIKSIIETDADFDIFELRKIGEALITENISNAVRNGWLSLKSMVDTGTHHHLVFFIDYGHPGNEQINIAHGNIELILEAGEYHSEQEAVADCLKILRQFNP